jgi:hypothetical protein
METIIRNITLTGLLALFLTSCSVTLPSFRRTQVNTDISMTTAVQQIEPLRREDYDILGPTSGKAGTSRFYVLCIPFGKFKSGAELYENAYYEAVANLQGADALLLPRQKHKKILIPLILVNYYRKEVEVSGVGISVRGKTISTSE